MGVAVADFADRSAAPAVEGVLLSPEQRNGDAIVLTHGAGADGNSRLLTAMSEAFAAAGYLVLRCNLPFRQERPHGPPFPASAARDREGLRRAIEVLRSKTSGRIFLGGHSYGGRQATMLAAEYPQMTPALLLFSYPLHPPRKPEQLRTAHLPNLRTPALFVHGGRDPFGSSAERETALALIPAKHELRAVENAGHDLLGKKTAGDLPSAVVTRFQVFVKSEL